MNVFPADTVGIHLISHHAVCCTCSGLLHKTNPAVTCQQIPFRSATDTIGFDCSSGTRNVLDKEYARRRKKYKRSSKHHKRLAELDTVHNQAFTDSPPPSNPPPLLSGVLHRLRLRLLAPFAV